MVRERRQRDSFMTNLPKITTRLHIGMVKATRAETDDQLLQSWLDELNLNYAPGVRKCLKTLVQVARFT